MLVGIVSLLALSCESEKETFEEFVGQGERVIVGGVQDVMISHGVGKLKLDVAISGDSKVKRIMINEGTTEVAALDLVRNKNGKDTVSYVLDLDEKLYNFVIKTQDDAGNESLPYEFVATVFAEKYIKNLSSRKIASVAFDASTARAVVSFGSPFERMVESTLTYTDRSGANKSITVANGEGSVEIDDFDADSKFQVVSSYTPPMQDGETSFEQFVSDEINEGDFPVCTASASATASATAFDLGQVNKDGNSTVESFTVQSDDCLDGGVSVKTTAPFEVALDMAGPFETEMSLEDISDAKTVYVRFSPTSGKNQVFNSQLSIEAANIVAPTTIDLKGEETGNSKSGLNILGPDESGDFTTIDLPNDAPAHSWGGPWHTDLFDGNVGTHGHTDNGYTPGHFTIDLGKDYVIAKVGWKPRSGFASRGLKRYQVWGLPGNMDVNAAATTKLIGDSESEWSKEMAQKGWTSLVDASLSDNPGDGGTTHDVSGFVYVRYIRVVVKESFSGDSFFNFGELELTADFDQ